MRGLSSAIVENLVAQCKELGLKPSDALSILADGLVSVAMAHFSGGKRSDVDVLCMLLQLVADSACAERAPVVQA